MNQHISNEPLDYSALSSKVPFREITKESGKFALIILFSATTFFVLIVTLEEAFRMPFSDWFFFLLIVLMFLIYGVRYSYIGAANTIRLKSFAKQNNFSYKEDIKYDGRQGLIFQEGSSREFTSILRSKNRAFSEIGNYKYTIGSGKYKQTYNYGYVRIKLPRRLPHMVLDAKKNNLFGKLSNLPTGFSNDQKLELEGDFNSHFTLYAPTQYKTDALYVFTPDVMQSMVDAANDYDCEIIDDSLYLYSSSKLKLADAKSLQEIVHIANLLNKEFTQQTDYYADARVGDRSQNVIAEPGKRLSTKVPIVTIIIIIFFSFFYILSFFS